VQGERASVRMPMPEKTGPQAVKSDVAAKAVELLGMLEEKPSEDALAGETKGKREVKLPTSFMVENWKKAVEETAAKPEAAEKKSTDELLLAPELEFPQAESEVAKVEGADEKPVKKGSGKIRVAILGGLLVAAGVGAAFAWYENWLPFLPRTNSAKVVAAVPGNSHPKVAEKKADAVKSGGRAGVGTTAASGPAANATKDAGVADVKDSRSAVESGGAVAAEKSEKAPVVETIERKRGESAGATTAAAKDAAAEENDVATDVIAPKLLKAVNPEYPVDAMRKYVTGDVRVEATVDAKGKVREAKAMFGPAALQEAAVDAVKQYEYAPATRGGKAVEGKVSVMVKFWFNP
jgi:TonB family protein